MPLIVLLMNNFLKKLKGDYIGYCRVIGAKGLMPSNAREKISEMIFFNGFCLRDSRISEKTRRFDNALAISVVSDRKKVIDDFFSFSVQDFTRANFLIFSKNSSQYLNGRIEGSRIEEKIIQLIKQFRRSKLKYRNKYQIVESW